MFETQPIINNPHVNNDQMYTIVAVVTQILDYIITSGVAYAWLYTGIASVYFYITEMDPITLYFHLNIHPRDSTTALESTSVCQNAMFVRPCLLTEKRDADWIQNAVDCNARFLVDPEAQLNLMSASPEAVMPETVSPGNAGYKPPRKRLSTPVVDRYAHRSDDASDNDGPSQFFT